jgi:tetratricopeptide (TPR) repeat protein
MGGAGVQRPGIHHRRGARSAARRACGGWAAAPAGTPPDAVVEAMELARRAEASDVGADALASIERAVERLRHAAADAPPGSLLPAVRAQRRYLGRLLDGRLTLGQRRRLLAAAGWLSVVLARLYFEAGDRDAAEASREAALRLARQAGNAELVAWVHEAGAWWALVDGRLREAIRLSRAGQDRAPPASAAAVQLALHEAQAWRQLGDPDEAAGALRQAALLRGMLPGGPPARGQVE